MPRFFIDENQIDNEHIILSGEDAHHVSRSLRMAQGEHITVCDGKANEYDCELCEFSEKTVKAKIISRKVSDVEPKIKLHLFQALPKGEKTDFIIQKSVECGAFDITLFESERCVVRAKPDAEERKTERRGRISLEAAKQSGRGIVPRVYPTVSFGEMLKCAGKSDAVLFCYEGEGTLPLGKALEALPADVKDVALVIGSEGGFSPSEVRKAEEAGFCKIGLGRRILRTETAGIFAMGAIVCRFELS